MLFGFRSFAPALVSSSALLLVCIGGCATDPTSDGNGSSNAEEALHRSEEPCPELGQTRCNGQCVITQFDDANCGGCGISCRTGGESDQSYCFHGGCVPQCAGGFKCGDSCCPQGSVCCHHTSSSNMPSFSACMKTSCAGF